jgi:DNA polymerase III alpha subunit (gram-positive type)
MILLGYDLETTGLDKVNDRMIEVGLVLYSTGQQKVLESTGFLVQSDKPILPEITEITGITQAAVDRFGYSPESALEYFLDFAEQADAVIGHNVIRFDKPVTDNTAKRLDMVLPEKLWIDTMTDIPGVTGEQLITMCAKHGFVNPNQHSAEDDAKSVLKLISGYDIEKIVERAKSPMVVILSHQGRGNNADAKKFKFRWNPEMKLWWKAVKEMDVAALAGEVNFDISRAGKEVSLEQLWES